MSAKATVVRRVSWPLVIPQLVAMGIVIAAIELLIRPATFYHSILWGCAIYLVYSFGSRLLLTRAHRAGRQLATAGKFKEAIAAFEKSYTFFSRYSWLDRYRYITLMSPSAMSYREMALINIGYCYVQLGKKARAREYYEKALEEFPQSVLAKNNLKLLGA
jgi:tetratricopeptide (TPR) repeat protein